MVHQLSRQEARRIAVRAQLLDAERPTDLLEVVRRLWVVQVDLTAAVAPSADLVLWSRLGRAYRPDDLDTVLADRDLVEYEGLLHAAEDMALFRADMRDWPGRPPLREWQEDTADWVEANSVCRDDILQQLRAEGPLPARELPDTCAVPWRSSGWNTGKNVLMLLNCMERRGEVAVSGREGRERLWDLADRVLPDDPAVPWQEAAAERDRRRLASLGIARARATQTLGEPNDVADAGEPAVVEGVRGTWRVDPAQLGRPFRGRTALLSPLDRLVFDRKRMSRPLRVRLPARDVQAGGRPAVGLLGDAGAPRRPARGQARRHRRPRGRGAARRRAPRGRAADGIHPGGDRARDPFARSAARSRAQLERP